MKKKLRIGILVDTKNIAAWSLKMLEQIQNSDHSEIVLIVGRDETSDKKATFVKKIWKNRKDWALMLFNKLEKKIFKLNPDAFVQRPIRELGSFPEIKVKTEVTENGCHFLPEDISKILQYEIDVFVKLGFGILSGEILSLPKYGIWSLQHSDTTVNSGSPASVLEVIEGWDETGAVLHIVSEDPDDLKVLASTISATDKVSIRRNKNSYYWKALSLVPRKLKELHKVGGDAFFETLGKNNIQVFYYSRTFQKPSNFKVIKAFIRIYSTKLLNSLYRMFFFDQWILLYSFNKNEGWSKSFSNFKRITPPKDRFWADPFIYEKDGKYYLFIEELLYKEKIGKISVMELDETGIYTSPKTIIEKNFHMSYPFIFEEGNDLYMLPETSGNRTIELYKCVSFPYKWEPYKVLMHDVYAVDSTILRYNGKYWLFCNMVENQGASSLDELFLFYSDSLLDGQWKEHPLNPIISDVRQARPAGRIFEENGRLYRPSQDSSKRYGYGMKINEIVELTETSYREVVAQSIYPDWEKDLLCTHTLNHSKKLTVIDALITRRK
ncbi:MAG TPA: hypothetical protein PKL92_07755 [Aquaticitalea sp.]|nr:hypothetical protein [Aquaticitalea sp.]